MLFTDEEIRSLPNHLSEPVPCQLVNGQDSTNAEQGKARKTRVPDMTG